MDNEASTTHYISAKGNQTPMSASPPKGTAIIGSANGNGSMASKGAQGALARSLEAHRNGAGSPGPGQHQKQASSGSMGSISAHNPVWKQEVILSVRLLSSLLKVLTL